MECCATWCACENRRLSPARSSSSAAARTHASHRPSRRAARCGNRAELYFCSPGKTVWTDASQLVSSGRSRIVGYCNRPKTCATWTWPTVYVLGFPEPHYILPCTACAVTYPNQSRFCQSRTLRRHRSLLHPVRRRAPANGTAGLRNRSSL